LFNSPESAFRFAFRVRERPIVSTSNALRSLTDKTMPARSELTAFDLHAQSGLIFLKINKMPDEQQCWVYLTYGNKEERQMASETLAQLLVSTNAEVSRMGLSHKQVTEILLSPSVRTSASTVGITTYKAYKIRKIISKALEGVMLRAVDDMWSWLNSGTKD